jgi:hypothetical protein
MNKISIEAINPRAASDCLETMEENRRNLRPGYVQRLAYEMKSGRWTLSNDAIVLLDGVLINGQHRLSALVQAGQTFQFVVLRTNNIQIRDVIDGGIGRKVSDVLALHGIPNARDSAAATFLIVSYDKGTITRTGKPGAGLSQTRKDQFIISRTDLIKYATDHAAELINVRGLVSPLYSNVRIIPISMGMSFLIIAQRNEEKKPYEFLSYLFKGGTIEDVCYDLRERLLKNAISTRKMLSAYVFGLLIKAYGFFLKNERPKYIKISEGEEFPKFPG